MSDRENKVLAKEGRSKIGRYLLASLDALHYEKIDLRPVHMTGGAPTLQRTSESFERGNVNRKLEKGNANTPEKSKGPLLCGVRRDGACRRALPIGCAGTGNRRRDG